MSDTGTCSIPITATESVLKSSDPLPDALPISGYDFNNGCNYQAILNNMRTVGFQATNFSIAVDIINDMINWSGEYVPEHDQEHEIRSEYIERPITTKCTIFLGFTSNMISCGNREVIRYLVQHRMVDALVTTGGGIEEDIIKCLAPHVLGSFHLDGRDLRRRGLNRIGNLIVPNANYCMFEDWVMPILKDLVQEQINTGSVLTPRSLIRRLGKEISNEDSVLYWAYKNDIPVFCPAITDGSLGDMLYFNSFKHETRLVIDIVQDVVEINNLALHAAKTGVIVLGGGLVKHHILNANLMRNGADYAVFVNTAHSWDGSDAGADPDESLSWGKLAPSSNSVKITADASFIFPLLVAQTFAQKSTKLS